MARLAGTFFSHFATIEMIQSPYFTDFRRRRPLFDFTDDWRVAIARSVMRVRVTAEWKANFRRLSRLLFYMQKVHFAKQFGECLRLEVSLAIKSRANFSVVEKLKEENVVVGCRKFAFGSVGKAFTFENRDIIIYALFAQSGRRLSWER